MKESKYIWIITIVVAVGFFILSLVGLGGIIYLCHINTDPTLVATASKMIQTDPSSAMAAMMMLTVDGNRLAIVVGLTAQAFTAFGSVLVIIFGRKAANANTTTTLSMDEHETTAKIEPSTK